MVKDKILEETYFYMRDRFNKNLYSSRKSDYELYLSKLKTINYGKKNHKKTRTKKDN